MGRAQQVDGDRTYHHGNLRRALMDEALKIIREQGVEAITLRDLARRTRVTHAAPHHHFRDKAALIAALSREGMTLLDEAMTAAEETAGSSPAERLLAVARAYVIFATGHPEYFAVMFRPEGCEPGPGPMETSSETSQASTQGVPWVPCASPEQSRAWQHLLNAITACQQAGVAPQGSPLPIAIQLWSLVHGLASLWVSGTLQCAPPEVGGIEEVTDMVLRLTGCDLALAARLEA